MICWRCVLERKRGELRGNNRMENVPDNKVHAWLIPSGHFQRQWPRGWTFNKKDVRSTEKLVSILMTLNRASPNSSSALKSWSLSCIIFLNISFKEKSGKKNSLITCFSRYQKINELGAWALSSRWKGWGRQGRDAKMWLRLVQWREEYQPWGRCGGAAMTFLGQLWEL